MRIMETDTHMHMNAQTMQKFEAVRAVIRRGNQVLLIRESEHYDGGANKGKWDFPGGKIKPGENYLRALARETKEEAGILIKVLWGFFEATWRPVVKGEALEIHGTFYLCSLVDMTEPKTGNDHSACGWFTIDQALQDLPLIEETANALRVMRELRLA